MCNYSNSGAHYLFTLDFIQLCHDAFYKAVELIEHFVSYASMFASRKRVPAKRYITQGFKEFLVRCSVVRYDCDYAININCKVFTFIGINYDLQHLC